MTTTQSKPLRYHAIQAAPHSSSHTESGSTVDGTLMASSPSDADIIRAIECMSIWIKRHLGSDGLVTAMKAFEGRLDEMLEHLSQKKLSGQLMSVKAAAQYLSLSERTIRDRIALRQWPAYRSGNAVRVDPMELKALMAKEFR